MCDTSIFYYDGDKIIAEREGNSWVVRYLLGLKSCGHVVSGQIRVYHADRLGSVRWVTDGGQNIVASYVYEGFGKIVGQNGSEEGEGQKGKEKQGKLIWSRRWDLNPRPGDYKSPALPLSYGGFAVESLAQSPQRLVIRLPHGLLNGSANGVHRRR